MQRKVTLKEVISVIKLSLIPIWGWPVSKDATKYKMFCVKLYHSLCIIMAIMLAIPIIFGAINHLKEPIYLVQELVISSSTLHVIANFIAYKVNYNDLQDITTKVEHFCDFMKPHEEIVIQRYIDKCVIFYGFSLFIFYFFTLITITLLPPVLHQPFPTLAEYPFDVIQQPLRTIIYMQQSLTGILVSGQLCTSVYIAFILWFTSARFEILCEELRNVGTDIYQLFKWIKLHQELLKYAVKISITVRAFVFITVACSTFCIIIILCLLLTHQSFIQLFQFFGLSLVCLAEVFMYTWPGEYLINMSSNVSLAAFDALQTDQPVIMWKCLQIIIMRSQKPVTVKIPCFLPALCYTYFTTYCSTILSYFTTLRVMINE
ncbi:uncharacterized protein LOC105428558 [Pogonomyrmex barbatus]|uniref:Odorant receptor n=1 Tax=Pogonomyrmex barbatus TaxID=144034 RepID=A0A6I9WIS6_9HYME|nr:uncharacterized protein LOC105428558 [Pogonomyrmex barbatus]